MAELPHGAWSVVGVVTHDEHGGYAVALAIETPDGRHDRLLHDPASCAALSDSAALLIALAVSPDSLEQGEQPPAPEPPRTEPEPEPVQLPERPATAQPEPEPDPEPQPTATAPPPPREPLQFAIGLMPGMDWGTLRGVTPLGRLSLSWQLPRLRVGVAGMFGGSPAFDVPPVSGIRLHTWNVAVEVGPVPTLGRFEFPLMGGVEAGQLLLTPRELLTPGTAQVAWAALLITPGVAWVPLRWLALTARVGTTVSFVRPDFTVAGVRTIHAPAPVGVRASLGVEFRIPLAMKPG